MAPAMTPGAGARPSAVRPRGYGVVVLVRDDVEVASWPLLVGGLGGAADLAAVGRLVRLQLAARRRGCSLRLRDACPQLLELLELVGLDEVVPAAGRLGGEVEGREHRAVSRKLWCPTIRSPESSMTWTAHGRCPPCGSGR